MALDEKYGKLKIGNIPDDEPVFVLRAQDVVAMNTLENYAHQAEVMGAKKSFVKDVLAVRDSFQKWQDDNDDKVKVPD